MVLLTPSVEPGEEEGEMVEDKKKKQTKDVENFEKDVENFEKEETEKKKKDKRNAVQYNILTSAKALVHTKVHEKRKEEEEKKTKKQGRWEEEEEEEWERVPAEMNQVS